LGYPDAREAAVLESELIAPLEASAKHRPLSVLESDSLARQIVALDGVSYPQARQQIREMMGFDLSARNPRAITIYNMWTTTRSQRIELKPHSAGDDQGNCSLSEGAASAPDVLGHGKLDAIPMLLDVLCYATGVRFAAVARAADHSAHIAVTDTFGGAPPCAAGELDLNASLCVPSQVLTMPLVADYDRINDDRAGRLPGPQSYVSIPIVATDGRSLGNLCAIGPTYSGLPQPHIVLIFRRLARLIGQQLEGELARVQQQAASDDERATGQWREQSMAILAHDLRNPLHAVLATADLLERRLAESVYAAMATRIKTQAHRMSGLINDVLEFARARFGSGIGVHPRATHNIARDLTAIVAELQVANPDRTIESDIHVRGSVFCDVARLQQVASNLIANALTHGFARSLVRVRASADETYLTFSVWNDGEPIPESVISKVFEPFWQQSSAAQHQGLGLGLYICSQIVRAHGGELSVSSTQEAGTQFSVRLPRQQPRHVSSGSGASHSRATGSAS